MSSYLHIICGPMFSGKTTRLIQAAHQYQSRNQQLLVVYPRKDTRYKPDSLTTHAGVSLSATPIDSAQQLLSLAINMQAICIDEAHFFGASLIDVIRTLLHEAAMPRSITIAGIERNHLGNPFEPFPWLLCEADEVTKLNSSCARCGMPAVHSKRLIESTQLIAVGGIGDYEARCRDCFAS